jgi:hypothetical protein
MVLLKKLRQHYKLADNKWVPKVFYNTIEEAIEENGKSNRFIYQCKVCKKYHIGRASKKQRNGVRK